MIHKEFHWKLILSKTKTGKYTSCVWEHGRTDVPALNMKSAETSVKIP